MDLPEHRSSGFRDAPLIEDPDPARVRGILTKYAGIRREAAGLKAAAEELDDVAAESLATVARCAIRAAAARKESRTGVRTTQVAASNGSDSCLYASTPTGAYALRASSVRGAHQAESVVRGA